MDRQAMIAPLPYGERRAVLELFNILDSQWMGGMLPHIRFVPGVTDYSPGPAEWGVAPEISGNDEVAGSGITQPPIIAVSLWRLYRLSRNPRVLIPVLEEAYLPIARFHNFLLNERDPHDEGLVTIVHPWESGTDNSPTFDESLEYAREELNVYGCKQRIRERKDVDRVVAEYRPGEKDYEVYGKLIDFYAGKNYNQRLIAKTSPFKVQDILFNAVLHRALLCMEEIAGVLARYYEESEPKKARYYRNEGILQKAFAERLRYGIEQKLYDPVEKIYYNYDLNMRTFVKIPKFQTLMPLFGEIAGEEHAVRLIELVKSPRHFWPDGGLPLCTVSVSHPIFNNVNYWRGPVWPIVNWFIIKGLKNYVPALERQLARITLEMIAEKHDLAQTAKLAAGLLEYATIDGTFTTPSRNQYMHGWLWDSGFAMLGWRTLEAPGDPAIWEKVTARKREMMEEGVPLREIRGKLGKEFAMPLFDEYYAPLTTATHQTGDPLGSEMMTWTAAVFLDLYDT